MLAEMIIRILVSVLLSTRYFWNTWKILRQISQLFLEIKITNRRKGGPTFSYSRNFKRPENIELFVHQMNSVTLIVTMALNFPRFGSTTIHHYNLIISEFFTTLNIFCSTLKSPARQEVQVSRKCIFRNPLAALVTSFLPRIHASA